MAEDDPLFLRAAAAIADSHKLAVQQRLLIADMASLYERRMIMAMKAVQGVTASEHELVERYRKLTEATSG